MLDEAKERARLLGDQIAVDCLSVPLSQGLAELDHALSCPDVRRTAC